MKIADSREMKEIDRITIEEYGIPSCVLMERAGLAVADRVRECALSRRVLALCGGGNNGGDGLVAARVLCGRGYSVKAVVVTGEDSLSTECAFQLDLARKTGVAVEFRNGIEPRDFHGGSVIDAVFGTGLSRPVSGDLARLFAILNKSGVPVVAVDIPSGISADTGDLLGAAVRADCTVTFGLPKRGHYLHPGAEFTGRLFIEDIGFPRSLAESVVLKVNLLDKCAAAVLVPPRPAHSHKGTYGHVLILGGSRGKTGAALLAARASLRTGSGLVSIGAPESLSAVFQSRVTDEMVIPLPDGGSGTLAYAAAEEVLEIIGEKIAAVAVGPGLGVTADTARLVSTLAEHSPVPVVIDADGLNSLCFGRDLLRTGKSPVILTPHPGEMRRLLAARRSQGGAGEASGMTTGEVDRARIDVARGYASDTGTQVVLKGSPTVIAGPGGDVFITTTGNPGMATAGAGDVLTGVIASLLGQGLSPQDASLLGVYLHGYAGDCGARAKGTHSLIASDIIEHLPDAFLSLTA